MKIKAVLFDLDGTLCDCTEIHYVSLNKALSDVSGTVISREEHTTQFNGLPTKKKLDKLISLNRIKKEDGPNIWNLKQKHTKGAIIDLLNIDSVKRELLQFLKQSNIKIACVTNSINETASLMLKTTGQLEFMDLLITNDMIKNPKPHAEGYIRAMIMLNSLPEETVVVEDSPVGLQSAYASGAVVWAINGYQDVTLQNFLEFSEKNA